jgi:hypothetical protein
MKELNHGFHGWARIKLEVDSKLDFTWVAGGKTMAVSQRKPIEKEISVEGQS